MRQSPNYSPQITQGKGLSLGFKQRQLSEKRFDHESTIFRPVFFSCQLLFARGKRLAINDNAKISTAELKIILNKSLP